MKHIGIAACSAEGAALCYRTICAGAGYAHPEISMHTPTVATYIDRIKRGDWDGVGEILLASAHKLAAIGADFLICPDNTAHQALEDILDYSPLPWLHIAAVVAETATNAGYRRVGILGTKWLVASNVYPDAFTAREIEAVRPRETEKMNRIIMAELVLSIVKPESISYLRSVIDQLRDDGCDAVVLGCTELPIVLGNHNASLPTLDSTRLLAAAALKEAHR